MNLFCVGSVVIGVYLYVDKLPGPGEDIKVNNSSYFVGGAELNTARVLNKKGLNVDFYSEIGADNYYNLITDTLTKEGINLVKNGFKSNNNICYILITPDGERTMLASGLFNLDIKNIKTNNSYNCFYVTGYELKEDYLNKYREIFDSSDVGKKFLDLSPIIKKHSHYLWDNSLKLFNVVTGTKAEFTELVEVLGLDKIKDLLLRYDIEKLYVKKGSQGSEIITRSYSQHADAQKIKARNTTGCGDAFHAGVIYGEVNNYEPSDTLKLANKLGAGVAQNTFSKFLKTLDTNKNITKRG